MRHFLGLSELSPVELVTLLERAIEIKKKPQKFTHALEQKTLLMLFEQPSVRTRVSFETGLTQMGGHAIYYDIQESTLGKKETIADYSQTVSRYVNFVAARLNDHNQILELARYSRVPVINLMSSFEHPCQGLADFQTILEHTGKLKGLNLAYLGDANNNVTHTLMFGSALLGMNVCIACPKDSGLAPKKEIFECAAQIASQNDCHLFLSHNPIEAVQNADVVVTDSWMSYRVPESEANSRIKLLKPFQVNEKLMQNAPKKPFFMHCLPAHRGMEVTNGVMDSAQSAVFDEAENRLHAQKAMLLWLQEQNAATTKKDNFSNF